MLHEKTHRARLDRLASALRMFGLVDRFGLADLLSNTELPSSVEVIETLRSNHTYLPHGVTPEYLANFLLMQIKGGRREGGDTEAESLLKTLQSIPTGDTGANQYHDLIIQLFCILLDGELRFVKKEAEQARRKKRIDILFSRHEDSQIFRSLDEHHGFKCNFVPAECKNYSKDIQNPEIDQLAGRLNDKIGRVGILTCRSIADVDSMNDRIQSCLNDKKLIIVLTDKDLIKMVDQAQRGSAPTVLAEKIRNALLG